MIRKLILAIAAVMTLSAGAQAQNVIVQSQAGAVNNSDTVQHSGTLTGNLAVLAQQGNFNVASAGQTGTFNVNVMAQVGFPGTDGAASNRAAVGQLGTLSDSPNVSAIAQVSSTSVANSFGLPVPLNSVMPFDQITGATGSNTSGIVQQTNP